MPLCLFVMIQYVHKCVIIIMDVTLVYILSAFHTISMRYILFTVYLY